MAEQRAAVDSEVGYFAMGRWVEKVLVEGHLAGQWEAEWGEGL